MPEIYFDIGEGFIIPETDLTYLKKHKLLGQDVLHFFNALSDLTGHKKGRLSEKERGNLNGVMFGFLWANSYTLFPFLRDNYGVKALNYSGIAHLLLTSHTPPSAKVELLRTMSTEMLEKFMNREAAAWFKKYGPHESEYLVSAIEQRDDIYGELPREFLKGILFE